MSTSPQPPEPSPVSGPPSAGPPKGESAAQVRASHQVVFVTYPKLLFIWPIILAGLLLWPLAAPTAPADHSPADAVQTTAPTVSPRLEVIGWVYIWIVVLVFLTLGVDVDRNMAAFWAILVGGLYVLGMWLHDVKGFTFFGNIYAWFASFDVQYNRSFGLALSIVMLVPYLVMIFWGRLNDRWRITHNEFEHYSFGRLDDSLGRGAKTIRTMFPDVFELLLGLAGTLIVFNASGTKELRRIPHVMFLPMRRKRLNQILERTAITMSQSEEEEDEEQSL